jgi:hypothetical protein
METATQLASKMTKLSREQLWDVYREFDWPETLTEDRYYMAPELMSLYGTELWDELSDEQRRRLSLFEIGNFFSLTLQGERPLVAGMSDRLYSKKVSPEITEYLHHFMDEENKHMVMFGMFCNRYVGKVYPEKKMALPRKYAKGEEEVAFFCKVLVVEEIGDYYNKVMMNDQRIDPLVAQLNRVHHRDESRHIGFGRRHLSELAAQWIPSVSEEELESFRSWLVSYVKSSWGDFYNPTMYKDAGLDNPYDVRKRAMAHPAQAQLRQKASQKLVNLFLKTGLLTEAPAL